MSTIFEGKLRRVGNSLAVVIPREILKQAGAEEGDSIKLSIFRPSIIRKKAFEEAAGIYRNAKPFVRDRRDRSY